MNGLGHGGNSGQKKESNKPVRTLQFLPVAAGIGMGAGRRRFQKPNPLKVIVPKKSVETSRPVSPRVLYSMDMLTLTQRVCEQVN